MFKSTESRRTWGYCWRIPYLRFEKYFSDHSWARDKMTSFHLWIRIAWRHAKVMLCMKCIADHYEILEALKYNLAFATSYGIMHKSCTVGWISKHVAESTNGDMGINRNSQVIWGCRFRIVVLLNLGIHSLRHFVAWVFPLMFLTFLATPSVTHLMYDSPTWGHQSGILISVLHAHVMLDVANILKSLPWEEHNLQFKKILMEDRVYDDGDGFY